MVVTQRIWIVQGTNKSICACPARPVRAQVPAVFRRYYKTAGIAPLVVNFSIWVNMSNTEKLIALISENTEKVSLLDTKMKVILFDNFSC